MTPEAIQEAYKRAKDVLDGFKRPSDQNARDVVSILRHYSIKPEKPKPDYDIPDFLKGLFRV